MTTSMETTPVKRLKDIPLWNWYCSAFPDSEDWQEWLCDVFREMVHRPGGWKVRLTRTNLTDATSAPVHTVMESAEMAIGRGEENDVILPEHTITKRHARLFQNPDAVRVEDLNSALGTMWNGRKLRATETPALSDDDNIVIFPHRFQIEIERVWTPATDVKLSRAICSIGTWEQFRGAIPAGFDAFAFHVMPTGKAACFTADNRLLRELAAGILQTAAPPLALSPSDEGLLELLLLACLERANRGLHYPFHFALGRRGSFLECGPDERGIALAATLSIGTSRGAVCGFLPFSLLRAMDAGWPERTPAVDTLDSHVVWKCPVSEGFVNLSEAEQVSIDPGDALIYTPRLAVLQPGNDAAGWLAARRGDRQAIVTTDFDRSLNMAETRTTDSVTFEELPLRIQVLFAECELTLAEARNLAPGSIVDLTRDPLDPVRLAVNGRVVGTGELVEIEGRMAVKIQEWSKRR
jgi:flagellar motor switch/type III secretory pathway protein FliN